MNIKIVASLFVAFGLALSAQSAEPKEIVGNAIKALQAKANYSWNSVSEMINRVVKLKQQARQASVSVAGHQE